MGRGRPLQVPAETIIEKLSQFRTRIFSNGVVVGVSDTVFQDISESLDRRMSIKAIYLFVKRNSLVREKYNEWGVTEENNRGDTPTRNSPIDTSSDSTEYDEFSDKSFIITLSAKEWESMSPRELYYSRKEKNGTKKYKGLTPNVWTHIVNEHFWLVTKCNCCLVFKRAQVNDTGNYYVKMEASCKGCRGTFIGYIDNVPSEHQRVTIRCKYISSNPCKSAPGKRQLKGIAKDEVKTALTNDRDTASGYRTKTANNVMTFGDKEPPHLPSLNAIRCLKYKIQEGKISEKNVTDAVIAAKYTTPFKESIHDVGLDKFFVRYWTPSQIHCYRELCQQVSNPTLIIDATGGLVKKISRPFKNKSGNIFLYQAVTIDRHNSSFPVTQMLSERHDNIAVQCWLEDWKRDGAPSPRTVICDRSKALLSGVTKAFTKFKSTFEYISQCYTILINKNYDHIPDCFVRCDVAHLIKNITTWKPIKTMNRGIKNFYVRSIVQILKSNDLNIIRQFLTALFIVAESETVGKMVVNEKVTEEDTPSEKSRKLLKEAITNICFEENFEFTEEELVSDEEEVVTENKINPFRFWAEDILKITREQVKCEGEHYNALHCPQLVPYILNLVEYLPLVSAVMVPIYRYGEITASSAAVESHFNAIKNRLFTDDDFPMRADQFLTKHIIRLEGQLKLAATGSVSTITLDEAPSDIENDKSSTTKKSSDLEAKTSHSRTRKAFSDHKLDCPECSIGNYPGGAHTCIKCKKPVHIIFESCSKAINFEEGFGQKRICISCFSENLPEDVARENWKGLGYSPIKSISHQNKSTYDSEEMTSSSKRKNEDNMDDYRKKTKKLNYKSYLIKQPDITNGSISGKGPRTVGVLKNGNRAAELKAIKLKDIPSTKLTLTNTCAFDSFSQILACCYNDSEKLKTFIDSLEEPTITTEFLKFCQELATRGVNNNTYKYRLKLLLKGFPDQQTYPGAITVLHTECTATTLISKMIQDFPSVKEAIHCNNCKLNKTLIRSSIAVSVSENRIHDLNDVLNELIQRESVLCHDCKGIKNIYRFPSEKWFFLELVNIMEEDSTDIVREPQIMPCELPIMLTINNIKYLLRGFIGFSGKRSSIDNVGHYTAFVKRANDAWELYDDTKDTKCSVSPSASVPCQVVIYTV